MLLFIVLILGSVDHRLRFVNSDKSGSDNYFLSLSLEIGDWRLAW